MTKSVSEHSHRIILRFVGAVTIFTGNGAREKGIVVPRKMLEAAARLDFWAPHFLFIVD